MIYTTSYEIEVMVDSASPLRPNLLSLRSNFLATSPTSLCLHFYLSLVSLSLPNISNGCVCQSKVFAIDLALL